MKPNITVDNKEVLKLLDKVCTSRNRSEIWNSAITMLALCISNVVEPDEEIFKEREAEFESEISKFKDRDAVLNLCSKIMELVGANPFDDALGVTFMYLNLGIQNRGQVFTPGSVAKMMARMTISEEEVKKAIKENRIYSILDPACGGGVMLLKSAESLKDNGFDLENKGFFVGQDIDRLCALMCYIQLALNEIPAIICIGDSLNNPITFDEDGKPIEKEGQELWFTPKYRFTYQGLRIKTKHTAA